MGFSIGQWVKITSGEHRGQRAMVTNLSEDETLLVRLNSDPRLKIVVPESSVESAEAPRRRGKK